MKRIDRIYHHVLSQTQNLTPDQLLLGYGLTTKAISEALDIQRTNTSKDLNKLVRQGLLGKIEGRPVKYVDINVLRHQPFSKPVASYFQDKKEPDDINSHSTIVTPSKNTPSSRDIFSQMIGVTGSMKNSVEQAKAAILYPPKGLNCLITGPTGSGKTYFAHAIFRFAKLNNLIPEDKDLIVFNCADYAHNPELLMSHLFGYAAGAFTGATKEKNGIIHEADGSILFLDEVHRLPPEGQEMVFYFLDHGTYSRLGESGKTHKADVRVICATTENPASALLNTFVRRIPIVIQLPNFEDRPAKEKVDLLRTMTSIEASRIKRKISLSEDVVKALIGSVSYGNVGQLKSNVQLVTARAFLNQMEQDELHIELEELTENIKDGMLQLANNRDSLNELSKILEPVMVVSPNEPAVAIQSDSYELPYNLYEIIGDKATLLEHDGLDKEAITHFIKTDINVHLKSFYKNHGFTFDSDNKLVELVDKRVLELTKQIYRFAQEQLGYHFQSNFIYAVSLHLSSFIKRSHSGKERDYTVNENIKAMVLDHPHEFEVAKEIKALIEDEFKQGLPESEVFYLAVLLISLKENKTVGRIGIVVAAHGKSTATSMVQVVTQLLNVDNLRAVDMPLEMAPSEALIAIITAVKEVNEGNGVLLLVDMGSLATFSEEIMRQTSIPIKTVDMVSTPIVLETARKTALIDTRLDDLYDSLKKFQGYDMSYSHPSSSTPKEKAIIAICASGIGTAERMKELIESTVSEENRTQLRVIPISVADVQSKIGTIQESYDVIASTGITDPKLAVPFISMENFFIGETSQIIEKLLSKTDYHQVTLSENEAKKVCQDYMSDSFSFVNPSKLIDPLWQFAKHLSSLLPQSDDLYHFQINLVMHTAGAIERIMTQDTLTLTTTQSKERLELPYTNEITKDIEELESILNLSIPVEERYFIQQIVLNSLTKNTTDIPTTTVDDFEL